VVAAPPPSLTSATDPRGSGIGAGNGTDSPLVPIVDVPHYFYSSKPVGGIPVVEEEVRMERFGGRMAGELSTTERDTHVAKLAWAERAAGLCHRHAVVDLARVQGATAALLVSAGADGVLKVWR
jgi:hypothetical protein